jgi:cell division protein FtsN
LQQEKEGGFMQYSIMLMSLLLLMPACQVKKTIEPERYARPRQTAPVIDPPPPAPTTLSESTLENPPAPEPQPRPAPPPPSPSAPPPPPSDAVREEVTYQVGSFSHEGNALAQKQRVEGKGFIGRVETEESGPVPQHRVIATFRGSDVQARELLATLGIHDAILIGGRADPTLRTPPPAREPEAYPAPAPQPSAVRGLSYQVGSFSQEANAQQLKSQLERDGFTVRIEPVVTNDAPAWRVIATWPGTDEEARARLLEHDIFRPVLLQKGVPLATAPPPAPASAPMDLPEDEPTAEDSFRFQVGAFQAVENAEALQQRLKAGGFSAEIELVEEGGEPTYRVVARKRGTVPELREALARMGVMNPILLGN